MANWWDDAPMADAAPASGSGPFAGAISSIESSGNYKAVGPATRTGDRALGKYQVMSANVGPWSKEVLGREVRPEEFMASPEIQDAIFKGKFGQYAEKYGPEGAARAWFAGEGGMNDPNRKDVLGTTVANYGAKFNKALGYAPEEKRPTDVSAQSKDWWANAPLAQEAPQGGSSTPQLEAGANGGPKRLVMDMSGKDRGAVEAGARGVAQGLTANFGDEIRGLVEASGANPDDPASLVKLISGALKYWTGDADAKKRYEETVKREREINKAAEEQHPIASTVGNIAGAVALPIGAAGQAATLPGRMAAGAGVGAALGGAAGVGEGVGAADSLSRGAVGTAVGGALGGVAPAAIEGVVRGARAAANPIANTIRGIRNPDDEAARRVATSLQRDMQADPAAASRLTPAEFAASAQSGGPATIMDIGGETTRALARSAANTSPEGRAAMGRAINDRFEGQTGRVTGWLRNTFHYPDAEAQSTAIEHVAKTVNKPAYAKAYAQGRAGVWDAELSELSQAPVVKDAVSAALKQAQNKSASGPLNQATLARWSNGGKPTLEFWDLVKRQIDQEINVAKKAGRREDVGTLTEVKNTIVKKLDDAVPSYAQARAGAAHFFGADNALEAGQKFVGNSMSASEARRLISKMSPQERQLFQDGFVSEFIGTLEKVGDRRSILNKIADSPAAREKLNIALGPQKAAELEAGLRVEGIMDLARNAVQGNSTTARQLAELGLAGGAYGFSGGGINPFTDPGAVVNAALVYGAARGRNVINERLSRRVAEMLVSNNPQTLLRGIRTVARNQTLFNSLRSADRGLARVGGEQSGGIPALQAAGIGRAEDQPNVPRPPGQ
jgi:hypothetical protein